MHNFPLHHDNFLFLVSLVSINLECVDNLCHHKILYKVENRSINMCLLLYTSIIFLAISISLIVYKLLQQSALQVVFNKQCS